MKKNLVTILLLLSISTMFIGCGANNKIENTETNNNIIATDTSSNATNADNVITMTKEMDYIKSYDNVKALKKDAQIIVKGEVTETNSYASDSTIITEFKLKVDKSYNNNSKVGDTLTIATAGGTVSFNEYAKYNNDDPFVIEKKNSKENLQNAKVTMKFQNSDLIQKGKDYIIFANKQPVLEGETHKKMYCSLNVGEGQFEVMTNKETNSVSLASSDSVKTLETNNRVINNSLKYNKDIQTFEKEIDK